MYLYAVVALVLGLWFSALLNQSWVTLTTVPPLDLLASVPGGRVISDLFVLITLYGLAWTAAAAVAHVSERLAVGYTRGPLPRLTAHGLSAFGHSRAGLEAILWSVLAGVPIVLLVRWLREGLTHGVAEAIVIGGALMLAAAQALRPFRWRTDVWPSLQALFRRVAHVASPPATSPPTQVQPPPSLAELRRRQVEQQLAAAYEPDLVWGGGWEEITIPPQMVPEPFFVEAGPWLAELNELCRRYPRDLHLTEEQRRAIASQFQQLFRYRYASAVAWGFANEEPGRDGRKALQVLSVYRHEDPAPVISHAEPAAVEPQWGPVSVRFRLWFRPSPTYLALQVDEVGAWWSGCPCDIHMPVAVEFVQARPLQAVRCWPFHEGGYVVKECYDVNSL